MMTNTQSNADLAADTLHASTAPVRDLIANVRKMEATFKQEREFILQHHPEEKVGDFPSLEGIETMSWGDLGIRECLAKLAVQSVERHADKVQAEVEEAEKARAESLRRQNMTPLEAKVEGLERANRYLAAELTKLKSALQPPASHGAPARAPQMLGLPGGMGRPPVGQTAGSGVRKIGTNGSVSTPDTAGAGFTRRIHPLNVIGGSGRR
jgi:hypothetical protein